MVAHLTKILLLCSIISVCRSKHIFVVNSYHESTQDELKSVVVLYRHGDRSPIGSFPNDPYYKSSYWPQGYGQLLKKGMMRQYNLGKWLRNRYGTFLPAEYSAKDALVYSTDIDRTLMSAQANLAGLYPPTDSETWEDDFFWNPVPIHLMSTDDPIFAMNSDCAKYNKLRKELETSDFFKNISVDNSDFFNQLSNYTGMNVSTLSDVQTIYDVLYVYQNHNASYLPTWSSDIKFDTLKYLAGLEFAKPTFTDELKRLRTGPFFNYLISHFSDIINNVTYATKFLMLSGHDSTVSAALGGMGAFDNHPPQFASTVIWELRKNAKKEYYVNILYKQSNDTDTLKKIDVYNCDFDCKFDDFKTNLELVSVDISAWHEECQSNSVQIVVSWLLLVTVTILQILA